MNLRPTTPVPGTPTPGTPRVAVARSVISDPPETRPVDPLVPNVAVPTEMPTPPGGDPVTSSASVGSDVKRGARGLLRNIRKLKNRHGIGP